MSKPSEKAMQIVRVMIDGLLEGIASREALAQIIDTHTAEALAERDVEYLEAEIELTFTLKEHQRVIEMAEKALTGLVMAYISLCSKHGENFHKCEGSWADHAQHTLAEIAKLRKE